MRIGTRGSKLALIQTNEVALSLGQAGTETSIVEIKSQGDSDLRSPIYSMGKVGVFVEKLNENILEGAIDCAVHSAKDIPSRMHPDLEISAVMKREVPTDSMLSELPLSELPQGSVIGTSSLRRIKGIEAIRNDLQIKDIRGNIDTRIGKLESGEYSGIIVATAALRRLAVDVSFYEFPALGIVPAANQGIIAVVSRKGTETSRILHSISHAQTMRQMSLERYVVETLSLGCSEPVGILATPSGSGMELLVRFYSKAGRNFMDFSSHIGNGETPGKLVDEIRNSIPEDFGYRL